METINPWYAGSVVAVQLVGLFLAVRALFKMPKWDPMKNIPHDSSYEDVFRDEQP